MKPASFSIPALALGARALTMTEVVAEIAQLFPDNIAFEGADAVISGLETAAGRLLGYPETESDLAGDGDGDDGNGSGADDTTTTAAAAATCGDVMLIFARGTGEPGNVGALVGPEFRDELEAALPGRAVSMQGVDRDAYAAVVAEYFTGGSTTGAEEMAKYVEEALASCEGTSVVMSGWSQGAQVVHRAADLVGASKMASVGAVVTFGDPDANTSFPGISSSKVRVICHENDDVCDFGSWLKPTHFTYAGDTPSAASFVASVL